MVWYGTSLYIYFHHKLSSNSRAAYVNRIKSLKNEFNKCVQCNCFHAERTKLIIVSATQNIQFVQEGKARIRIGKLLLSVKVKVE
jgi:hypothetical protein